MSILNKDWIDLVNRTSHDYVNGVEKFLDFAFSKRPPGTKEITCPCKNCSNRYHRDRETNTYNQDTSNDDAGDMNVRSNMRKLVEEGLGICERLHEIDEVVQSDKATADFLKLLKDVESELWEGCEEFTALSFIVELLHLKAISRWSNKSFTELLKTLKRALPKTTKLPNSCNDAYKMTGDLGFSYKTWDACVNHCMLFRNETEKLDKCKICGASRYKKMDADKCNAGGKNANELKELWETGVRTYDASKNAKNANELKELKELWETGVRSYGNRIAVKRFLHQKANERCI
ncbi:hypothetical protein POM88_039084 [Heracleum sosnowskyi]|uniref:Transposase-associated domain-containing protein n=1 Tax=Heracleum sosnowskyi TaxID=360622 RepID=A0AAD8HC40_9APIA|nr:hypothetical protein POM88_039084 [Heracleum sosnowskyi]